MITRMPTIDPEILSPELNYFDRGFIFHLYGSSQPFPQARPPVTIPYASGNTKRAAVTMLQTHAVEDAEGLAKFLALGILSARADLRAAMDPATLSQQVDAELLLRQQDRTGILSLDRGQIQDEIMMGLITRMDALDFFTTRFYSSLEGATLSDVDLANIEQIVPVTPSILRLIGAKKIVSFKPEQYPGLHNNANRLVYAIADQYRRLPEEKLDVVLAPYR